jgi:cytochrome oxidase Cu insertion factor (SCO1/SenC/PrrC family)
MSFQFKTLVQTSLIASIGLCLLACSPTDSNTNKDNGSASSSLSSVLGNSTPFKSIDITGAEHAKDFDLPDQNGQRRSIKDFQGKVVVMFFGYTQCPAVCPTARMVLL